MSTYFTCLANQKPSDGFFQLGSDQNFILGGAAGFPSPQVPNLGLEDFTPGAFDYLLNADGSYDLDELGWPIILDAAIALVANAISSAAASSLDTPVISPSTALGRANPVCSLCGSGNLLLQSNTFPNAAWIKGASSVSAAGIQGPDGGSAWKLIEDGTTNFHILSAVTPTRVSSAVTMTFAMYVRYIDRSVQLQIASSGAGTNGANATYDLVAHTVLNTGTFGAGFAVTASGLITDEWASGAAGNGWYKAYFTCTTTADTFNTPSLILNNPISTGIYAGNTTSGIYCAYAHVMIGGLTGYVPTTASIDPGGAIASPTIFRSTLLTPNALSSAAASTIATPAIAQGHIIVAVADASAAASNLDTPALVGSLKAATAIASATVSLLATPALVGSLKTATAIASAAASNLDTPALVGSLKTATAIASFAASALNTPALIGSLKTANPITSAAASDLGIPSIAQIGAIIANPVASAAVSALGTPALLQVQVLAGTAILSLTSSNGAPGLIGGLNPATAIVSAAISTLGTPGLVQALPAATPDTTLAAILGTPAIIGSLASATAISSAAVSALGTPAITQKQILVAVAIASATVSDLSVALILVSPQLGANEILTQPASLGIPTSFQSYFLPVNAISTLASSLGSPSFAQVNLLSPSSLSSLVAALGSPTLAQNNQLVAALLQSLNAVIGIAAGLQQRHVLSASTIDSATVSALGNAFLIQSGGLIANAIKSASASMASMTSIAQTHALLAVPTPTQGAIIGVPSLSQFHVLSGNQILSLTANIGTSAALPSTIMAAISIETLISFLGSPALNLVAAGEISQIISGQAAQYLLTGGWTIPMSACQNIDKYHEGETWIIPFLSRNFDQTILPLPLGSSAEFRLADPAGTVLTVSTDDTITITDGPGGAGTINISPALQTAANISARKSYRFELRIETPSLVSVQAEGPFTVLPSLFLN